MSDVQWTQAPPPRRARTDRYKALAEELRANPGKWAVAEESLDSYRTQAAVAATRINKGENGAFPDREFEATSSKVEGKTRLLVRYVGPGKVYRDFEETGEKADPIED
jgi:hypothetical protein